MLLLAAQELFEFIRNENIKSVITHFGTEFVTEFQSIDYGTAKRSTVAAERVHTNAILNARSDNVQRHS